jgi:predicted RNA-binding Zn-ribbon protein involved in translation (DUF1610 family)
VTCPNCGAEMWRSSEGSIIKQDSKARVVEYTDAHGHRCHSLGYRQVGFTAVYECPKCEAEWLWATNRKMEQIKRPVDTSVVSDVEA